MGKRVDREGPIHCAIVDWLRAVLPPDNIVHHLRNEINRSGSSIARELQRAARMGAVKGMPDLIILTYRGAFFMEVKAPGNYADKTQKAVHEGLDRLGYGVAVVRSIDDAREALVAWGLGFREVVK